MNLETGALIAQIVSGVAVFLTLILLVIEIRANTAAIRAASRQSIAERAGNFALAVASSHELAGIQARVMGGSAEALQAHGYLVAALQLVQESWFLHRDGFLEDSVWRTRANLALALLRTDYALTLYDRVKVAGTLAPEFSAWLDATLAGHTAPVGTG